MSTTTNIKCAVDYYRDIKDIVSEAIAENPDDIDAQIEFIYESFEWSEWLVYTSNHGLIMKYTRSMGEIDAAEIAEQLTHINGECGDYFKVRQLWAAQAMKCDVITEHQTQLGARN